MVVQLNPMTLAEAEALLEEINWRPDMTREEMVDAAGARLDDVETAIRIWVAARRAEVTPLQALLADMASGKIPNS